MDQPSKVANPARGQLKRENQYFPVPYAFNPQTVRCTVSSEVRHACLQNLRGCAKDDGIRA